MPSPREIFLTTFEREHATTLKVLRAFPSAQSAFKPAERSPSAHQLAWTFVMEQRMIRAAVTDTLKLTGSMPAAPESYDTIVGQFHADFEELVTVIRTAPDSRFEQGTVQFPSGPGKIGQFPVIDFCWFMLFDQIHHRGQLSVYVRMQGGKLPSIYGPSADEPWR
jgi:uncharacterized damage-inducible protein DinB